MYRDGLPPHEAWGLELTEGGVVQVQGKTVTP